jgi:hypothetical protein
MYSGGFARFYRAPAPKSKRHVRGELAPPPNDRVVCATSIHQSILRVGCRREAPGIAADIPDRVDAKAAAGGGGVARRAGGGSGEGAVGREVGGGCAAVRELWAISPPARALFVAARAGGGSADGAWCVAFEAPTKRRQTARHDFGLARARGHVYDVVWNQQRRRSRADAAKQKQRCGGSTASASVSAR